LELLGAYPLATASSAAFYVLLVALAIPHLRPYFSVLFVHPIPPHQTYQLGFDTLRGFAAIYVAFGHCWWATYPIFAATQHVAPFIAFNTKAVPIFAVLSGFLIYRSCISAVSGIAQLRAYIVRRFFRIYPVYLLGIVLSLLMGQYIGSPQFSPSGYLVSDIFMFTSLNWPGGFANPPTWSLYIEVSFYAVLPLMIIAVGQKRMAALCSILLLACVIADYPSRVFVLWRYFFIGIIASEVSKKISFRPALAAFLIGICLIYYDLGGPPHDWFGLIGIGQIHHDYSTLGLGLGCGLILVSLPHLPQIGAMLNILPLRLLGVISYSVYITHFFYIRANFPEIALFSQAGTDPLYQHFKTLAPFPAWYLPLVFFPGVLFWGAASFVLVERPGILLGRFILKRTRDVQKRAPISDADSAHEHYASSRAESEGVTAASRALDHSEAVTNSRG
jgi:peptidoglycan/LPS O-acetylase OafA/YrhL